MTTRSPHIGRPLYYAICESLVGRRRKLTETTAIHSALHKHRNQPVRDAVDDAPSSRLE